MTSSTSDLSQSELHLIKTIRTGLIVTPGEVSDGAAFYITDFVSSTGLNLRHGVGGEIEEEAK